jgi:hypothetical protein
MDGTAAPPSPPTDRSGPPGPPAWAGPSKSARVLRWAISLLALTLGLVLLVSGHVLIGGIVMVMAGLRLVLLVTTGRRRKAFQAAIAARRAGAGPWAGRRWSA